MLVANAPVSYGAFELTVGVNPGVPSAEDVLEHVSANGYVGIDLGPVGYLGTGETLGPRLAERGLALCGGYVPLPFSDPAALDRAMGDLEAALDMFDAAWTHAPGPRKPVVTLADAGSPEREAQPGRAARDRSIGLDEAGWRRFAASMTRVLDRCDERGFPAAFHHHMGTYVEAPWEIEEVLSRTEVNLCLDTGHLLLGGGEPIAGLREWGDRVTHVHLKDADLAILEKIVAENAPNVEIWRRRAFRPLGDGDLDGAGFVSALRERQFSGWLIVEQDALPELDPSGEQVFRDQAANRAYLRELGL